jgi:hypothetical protein
MSGVADRAAATGVIPSGLDHRAQRARPASLRRRPSVTEHPSMGSFVGRRRAKYGGRTIGPGGARIRAIPETSLRLRRHSHISTRVIDSVPPGWYVASSARRLAPRTAPSRPPTRRPGRRQDGDLGRVHPDVGDRAVGQVGITSRR